MSPFRGIPVRGTVALDTFDPLLPAEVVNDQLLEEWRAYLKDCLRNNFLVDVRLEIAATGGTVLKVEKAAEGLSGFAQTVPTDPMLTEFARECLKDFIRSRRKDRT